MGVVVQPNYTAFITRYGQFNPSGGSQPVSPELYQAYFSEAGLYQNNEGGGPVNNSGRALLLMQMLVAHIAQLNTPDAAGGAASPLVGRVSNASEGSVNVSSENNYPPGSAQWFQQTKFGSAWWQATAQYRTMRYRPGPVNGVPANQNGWAGGIPGGGWPFGRFR